MYSTQNSPGYKAWEKCHVDVDGSYLYRNREQLEASGITHAPLPFPTFPPLGWTLITDSNQRDVKITLLVVHPTTLYEYLAEGVGNVSGKGAFRALTRGYTHGFRMPQQT